MNLSTVVVLMPSHPGPASRAAHTRARTRAGTVATPTTTHRRASPPHTPCHPLAPSLRTTPCPRLQAPRGNRGAPCTTPVQQPLPAAIQTTANHRLTSGNTANDHDFPTYPTPPTHHTTTNRRHTTQSSDLRRCQTINTKCPTLPRLPVGVSWREKELTMDAHRILSK